MGGQINNASLNGLLTVLNRIMYIKESGLLWWLMGKKNLPANAGDSSLILGLGRSPGEGNGNPL